MLILNEKKLYQRQKPDKMFKKAPFLPSQPRRAETRLSTGKAVKSPSPPLSKGEWGDFARGAYTEVREHEKSPTRLRETASARQGTLACQP